MANNTPYQIAQELCKRDFSVIPSSGGKDHKPPLVARVQWQKKRSTHEQLEKWEHELHPAF